MTSYLWISLLACLLGAKAQDLDLSDALDPTPKPGEAPPKPDVKPPKTDDDFLDLSDALGPDPPNEPKKPAPAPPKPADPNNPPQNGGGGFSDSDLGDVAGGSDYKPDAGRGGHGGRASDPGYDSTGDGADQSQDLNQLWLQFLRLLGDNVPECLHAWTDNLRQVVGSLLETVLDLLDSAEGEKRS